MTDAEKRKYKNNLHQYAVEIIRQRITDTKLFMENAQASANTEEKSSAGDKYETSRAMSQLEKDMHAKQLGANKLELAALLSIDCSILYNSISTGSIVVCDEFSFYIAAGLGKISLDGRDFYFLSPAAPVAKLLFKKAAGDTFVFDKKQITIKEVY
jgi:hypothetical protein